MSPAEKRESLWMLIIGPTIWAAHFMASYVGAAVWCAKVVGRDGGLGALRWGLAGLTVVALAGIAAAAWIGWRRHSYGKATVPHDFPTDADRHRFLGFATLLLAGLSFVATLYVALPLIFVASCR